MSKKEKGTEKGMSMLRRSTQYKEMTETDKFISLNQLADYLCAYGNKSKKDEEFEAAMINSCFLRDVANELFLSNLNKDSIKRYENLTKELLSVPLNPYYDEMLKETIENEKIWKYQAQSLLKRCKKIQAEDSKKYFSKIDNSIKK